MRAELFIQGSLWPEELEAPLSTVTWSYSRRDVLEKCARRYYYEYYGGAARAEPHQVEVRRLRRIQNRYERAGTILHLVIAAYLRAAQKGELWTAERLLRWATTILATDWNYSQTHPDGDAAPKQPFPPVLLREFHYRETDAAEKIRDAERRLTAALGAFLSEPVFEPFRIAGRREDALVEARLALSMLPCRVTGQIDLAYPGERFTIVDWKMGAGDGSGNDSLQLALYALWASTARGVATDSLAVYKAHLGGNVVQEFRVSDKLLASARARVLQDAERMAFLARYGNDGVAEAFTPNPHRAVCALCSYQRLCPGGKVFLDD